MPAAFEPAVTTRSIDRRRLLGGSAAGLLFATLPGIQVVDGSGSSGAGSRDVARQADPAGATLAERWVVPDDLPELPDVTAAALFVGAIDSGRVLFARDPEVQRAPASTAKIAVALTVLDVMTDLDEVVTIDVEDEVNWGIYSNAQLRAEDEVTVRDLLYGLLVPSGSDAARALARSAGLTLDPDGDDPTATFLDAVNAKSASLGTTSTMILHPAGEDIDGQITTARDIAILAAALLDNDVLAEIVSTQVYGMDVAGPYERVVELSNTNALLGEDGIIGVKTGTTEAAGACLVTAEEVDGDRIVIAVLGSALSYDENDIVIEDRRYEDTLALLDAVSIYYRLGTSRW